MEAFEVASQSTFDICGFHEAQQFPDGICESLLVSQVLSLEKQM